MAKILGKKKISIPDIRFTVQVWKENGKYIAYAPELDVSSFGDSVSHAKVRLREAVTLFLEGASRLGTLEDILSEAGFQSYRNTYPPRRVLARRSTMALDTKSLFLYGLESSVPGPS